jgi:signal transduction histidine kinase/DNA-binding response OmpR family regulator/ligand-binding sensor domain-containing protein
LGQSFVFHHFDVSDGLSDNTVKCITQDNHGFIWHGTFNGLCRFDGVEFSVFRHNPNDSLSLLSNRISALLAVEDGLWVGTDEGLNFFSFEDYRFYPCQYSSDPAMKDTQTMATDVKSIVAIADKIFVLSNGNLFIHKQGCGFELSDYQTESNWTSITAYKDEYLLAHAWDGLYLLDTENRKVVSKLLYKSNAIDDIVFYSRNRNTVYVGYGLGYATETFRVNAANRLERIASDAPSDIKSIIDYNDGILFGTDGKGLMCYDHHLLTAYTPQNSNIQSDAVFSLFVDKDNNLWVGTYRGGVNLYSLHYESFKSLTVNNKQLTHNIVTAVLTDGNKIFTGLDGGGLNVYDTKSGKLSSYTTQNSRIEGDNVLSLAKDEKYVWLGIYNKNLCRFSLSDNTFKTYPLPPRKSMFNYIWEIKDDGNGNIWILGENIYCFNKKEETFTKLNKEEIHGSSMAFDGDAVWISSVKNGLYKLDGKTGDTLRHYTKKSKQMPLVSDVLRYLFIDSKHNLWFTADNSGLYKLDEEKEKITYYGTQNGLTNPNVVSMLEENDGSLWTATLNGLFKYNPQTETFVRFGMEDNMPSAQFNYNACYKDGETLYFGSTKGLIYFEPGKIKYDKPFNPVCFTGFEVLNDKKDFIHLYSDTPEEIHLAYNQNFFTIHFTIPELVSPDKLFLSCSMQNFEQDWRDVSHGRKITYTNVPPGEYVFCVRTSNRDGTWNNSVSKLKIIITPPWWKTTWAYFLWALIVLGIMFLIFRFYKREMNIKQLVRMKVMEKELNDQKLRFFTNISHEFRTPLTLILLPLEALIKNEKDSLLHSKLSKIYKNAKDLLTLVNQLLDFRKLEMKGEKLNLTYGDLVEFTDTVFQTFKEIADSEQKDLNLSVKTENLYMSFDKNKVLKIINNLLSNAFKYTSARAQITISLNKETKNGREYAKIRVADTGKGIPADKLSHIFERFYQLDNSEQGKPGSGIGLHLVKEYVNLHEGIIEVESVKDKGSTFSVFLPVDLKTEVSAHSALDAELAGNKSNEELQVNTAMTGVSEQKTILIVEDNNEFRQFLVEQLEKDYRIVQAADGEKGEQQALKTLPDLIITDIMMPKVDGVELCKRIKTNIHISHIPVIMLTARASDESKLSSYEAGADEYISKPFNFDILLLRVRKLIAQQEARKAQFRTTIEVNPSKITTTSLDEELIRKALSFIEENMNNEEYFVDDLSRDMSMSKTSLYNKILSITGLAPAQFIRSIRLKRAAQLLQDSQFNISEIADIAGFGTIKYFNIHFKEEFGQTPTQYRKKMQKNGDSE